MNSLKNFSQINYVSPVDAIITQIRDLIANGYLNSGDRLPSERQLSERFGVGRTHLREALRKLEFYGILKTVPQSGTFVSGLGLTALKGLISNMLDLQGNDFKSLVESRVILEVNICELAAANRTEKDIGEIKKAFEAHKEKILRNENAVEEDLLFHITIADASKNSVLKSLLMTIAPDIMRYFKEHNVCGNGRAEDAIDHHETLLQHIIDQNVKQAGESLKEHLSEISKYVKGLDNDFSLKDATD